MPREASCEIAELAFEYGGDVTGVWFGNRAADLTHTGDTAQDVSQILFAFRGSSRFLVDQFS